MRNGFLILGVLLVSMGPSICSGLDLDLDHEISVLNQTLFQQAKEGVLLREARDRMSGIGMKRTRESQKRRKNPLEDLRSTDGSARDQRNDQGQTRRERDREL